MFHPPIEYPETAPPQPRPPPHPSRRTSMKMPWSLSTKSKKLKKKDGATAADGEEQQPLSPPTSAASNYDSGKQNDTEYGSEATKDTQDQLTLDSRSYSTFSTDKVTVSDADTDDVEDVQGGRGQTLAQFLLEEAKATKSNAPAAVKSELPSTSDAQTSKAPEQKTSRPKSIEYDEHGEPFFELSYTPAEVQLIASEIYNQTVAETTLVLLASWIRASPENFEIATKYIRELATDRGYKVERTNNPHLCELVRQVNDMRSKEARSPIICEQAPYIRSQESYAILRDPDDMCTFADPSSEDLPVALRQIRNRKVYPSYLSSPLSSPTRDFPPDTPDRPLPLSLRSRQSAASNLTPTTAHRSVSAPLGPSAGFGPSMLSPIKFPRGSLILEETAAHPLLTAPDRPARPFSIETGNDDVFGIESRQGTSHSAPTTAHEDLSLDGDLGTARRYASAGHEHQYAQGPYQLSASDAYSDGESEDQESGGEKRNTDAAGSPTLRDDESDMHTYTGSASSSILETASINGTEDGQVHYSYADAAVPSEAAVQAVAASRKARQARKKISGPPPAAFVSNFHRPLPLRSYESEAHLFPTSGAQGGSSHNRAQSAGSIGRSSRPISLAIDALPQTAPAQLIELPPRSSSIRTNTIPLPIQSDSMSGRSRLSSRIDEAQEHDVETRRDVLDPSTGRTPRGDSLAMTLSQFPVPPMQNPVGAVPMTVARATAAAANINPVASLLQAVTIITAHAANVKGLLEQTRDRGDQLPVSDWDRMTQFERSWRSDREELLIAIYGRHDTWLSDEDVEYVDLIWMELRASPSATWVLDLFHHDDEMF